MCVWEYDLGLAARLETYKLLMLQLKSKGHLLIEFSLAREVSPCSIKSFN
jgi:hypothetical protein